MSEETRVSYILAASGEKAEKILRKVFEAANIPPEEKVLDEIGKTPSNHILKGEFSLASREDVDRFVAKARDLSEELEYRLMIWPAAVLKR